MEHLNVLFRIFYVLCVFQNFDVDFWPLLKAEKVLATKKFFFLQNSIFYYPYESINFQPAGLLKIALIVTPLLLHDNLCVNLEFMHLVTTTHIPH